MPESGKNDVRELIIQAAWNVFARFGFKKAAVDDIAEAAGKAKSSVYHYFKSKEEIFEIIVERESNAFMEEISNAVDGAGSPEDKIRAYVITRIKRVLRLMNRHSGLKDVYLDHFGFIEKFRKVHDKKEVQKVKEILQDGVKRGVFAGIDVDSLAELFVISLKGLEYEWANVGDFSEIEKTVNSNMDHLLYGIVKR